MSSSNINDIYIIYGLSKQNTNNKYFEQLNCFNNKIIVCNNCNNCNNNNNNNCNNCNKNNCNNNNCNNNCKNSDCKNNLTN